MTETGDDGILLCTVLESWISNFINLVYPLSCLICRIRLDPSSDKPLCKTCWNKIAYNLPPFCRVCGKHLPAKYQYQALICADCQQTLFFFHRAHAVCAYDGIIKECVHLFKYNAKLSLAKPLSKLMISFAHKFLDMQNIDLILAVPLHNRKQRQRQFNQVQILAQSLAGAFSKNAPAKLIIKTKSAPAQASLSRTERLKSIRDSLKVKQANLVKDKRILLVDDVLTTGATANECAKVLQEAGAKRIEVFTLARGI